MSLFEILFERKNPGNIGTLERTTSPYEKELTLGKFIFESIGSLALLVGGSIAVYRSFNSIKSIIVFLLLAGVYCFIGYMINPKPDYDNIGLLGGLMDNPFRYSDDINRSLIFFKIVLLPGRFIATTVVHIIDVVLGDYQF